MKKKINFSELQRFDKVDANDLQEHIYAQLEEYTGAQYKSSPYGLADISGQLDTARFRAMNGPLTIIQYIGVDQVNDTYSIQTPFSVVERNTGDIITFSQEDIDLGYGVMPLTSVQAFVDENAADFRLNDVNSVYTSLAIFAYPVSDQEREDRAFFDVNTNSTVQQNTIIRNRTRLQPFVDIYEIGVNKQDANGNYPTFLGKWEFGRIESSMRTDNGGGNFTLNPVSGWATQAGWIANSVWNSILSDELNVMNTIVHSDRAVANADKLPNTITEPFSLRNTSSRLAKNDIRLAFDHIIRLINRIQCAGLNDPADTDLGVRNDVNIVYDAYGIETGVNKTVTNALEAEHPPYSLRGLKAVIDAKEDNTLHSSKTFQFEKYVATGYPDNVARTAIKMTTNSGSGNDFDFTILPDFYELFTSSLSITEPQGVQPAMDVGSAGAETATGKIFNTSGQGISNAGLYEAMFRSLVISLPPEYLGYKITHFSITKTLTYPDHPDGTYYFEQGSGHRQITANREFVEAFVIFDDDNARPGATTGWSTSQSLSNANIATSIGRTNNQGVKVSAPGIRLQMGPSGIFTYAYQSTNFKPGFNVSIGLKKIT